MIKSDTSVWRPYCAQNRFLERLVRGAESSDTIPKGNISTTAATSSSDESARGAVLTINTTNAFWTGAIAPLWAQKAAAAALKQAAREELQMVRI